MILAMHIPNKRVAVHFMATQSTNWPDFVLSAKLFAKNFAFN